MNNIKIARKLVKIAKNLVAISMTNKNFKQYADEYERIFHERPNPNLFDLFKTKKQLLTFLKNKKRSFPHLKEFLNDGKLNELLSNKMMCVVSAGRNSEEIDNPGLITDSGVKKRYDELKTFLETLKLPYYEVYGLYFGSHEVSYLVDLTNDGKYLNNSGKVQQNLEKIRNFCLGQVKQDCIIEGIGNVTVFQYSGKYIEQDKNNPENDPYNNEGRSTIFTKSPKRLKKRDFEERGIKDVSHSFSKNYDFDNEVSGTKY